MQTAELLWTVELLAQATLSGWNWGGTVASRELQEDARRLTRNWASPRQVPLIGPPDLGLS
jgi:hypothetical protein